jgi:hypothetical protein
VLPGRGAEHYATIVPELLRRHQADIAVVYFSVATDATDETPSRGLFDWRALGAARLAATWGWLPATAEPAPVEHAEGSRDRFTSYLSRHWRGELALPVSYWINVVLVGVVLAVIIAALGQLTDWSASIWTILAAVLGARPSNRLDGHHSSDPWLVQPTEHPVGDAIGLAR